jgi:hypothetical protein
MGEVMPPTISSDAQATNGANGSTDSRDELNVVVTGFDVHYPPALLRL